MSCPPQSETLKAYAPYLKFKAKLQRIGNSELYPDTLSAYLVLTEERKLRGMVANLRDRGWVLHAYVDRHFLSETGPFETRVAAVRWLEEGGR